jgi:hypothetical protein
MSLVPALRIIGPELTCESRALRPHAEEERMARAAVTQMLDMIGRLSVDELQEVHEAIQARLEKTSTTDSREAFHQALLDSGLVKQIKPRSPLRDADRPLVPIQGKPLSETIIEERR